MVMDMGRRTTMTRTVLSIRRPVRPGDADYAFRLVLSEMNRALADARDTLDQLNVQDPADVLRRVLAAMQDELR